MTSKEPFHLGYKQRKFVRKPYSLNHFEKSVYSQRGEDGIIERIFDLIKPKTKYAVEFGAWDGKHLSNVFNLVKNHGWAALMIEGNTSRISDLIKTSQEVDGRITPVEGLVGINDYKKLDEYLTEQNAPTDFDLLSIDVDGIDWHIWESLKNFHPRVVIIEFNPSVPADVFFVQAPNESINEGSSAASLVELGRLKGYSLAAATHCNLIFINNQEFPLLGIADNCLENLWEAPAQGALFHGYNGKIYTIRMDKLLWHPVRINHDSLQILKEFSFSGAIQPE